MTRDEKPASGRRDVAGTPHRARADGGPLVAPVTDLKGVGQAMADKLATLGLRHVEDLLFHLPFRYQDRTRISAVGAVQPGREVVVRVEVVMAEVVMRRRRALLVRVRDGTGSLMLRFFHFGQAQLRQFEPGTRLQCFGEIRRGPGQLEMVHPEYRVLIGDEDDEVLDATLTPFYPATEGVQQATLRRLSEQALARLEATELADWLPADACERLGLPDLSSALRIVHRPPPGIDVVSLTDGLHPAHRRLAFEELVAHRIGLRRLRVTQRTRTAPVIPARGALSRALESALGFALTGAQSRVLDEVRGDMATAEPMLRLVQGDVGAGKTVIAALAAADAVAAGYQAALMAPTEILAEQHLLNFADWFDALGIKVGWLTGKLRAAKRRDAIESVALGQTRIVIGTHALFQADVVFENLGLAIIDEQHRFGVHQRLALRNKGEREGPTEADARRPHQLIMTATPIPRTLAMTAYADLDVSVVDELPPGRKPVTTVAIDMERRAEVIARVDKAIEEGRQVYWVCTLIEESEHLQAAAAEDTVALLESLLPARRIGLVHGRLKSTEKEAIMQRFKARELELLVATTVIEVGVDVPNASLMIIENAERLGLSQLHQLRGRVGRGDAQSNCLLLYQSPLSVGARERLGIMRATNDGFAIARKDLELRGAGEVLGTRQTGLAEFRIAELGRDEDLLDDVSEVADRLLEHDAAAVAALVRRWIGEAKQHYGAV